MKGVGKAERHKRANDLLERVAMGLASNKKLPDHISGKEGMQDVKIMQAIYKAAETGKRVSI